MWIHLAKQPFASCYQVVFFSLLQASGQTLKVKKNQIKGKKTNECKKGKKLLLAAEMEEEDSATTSSSVKKGKADSKKRKNDENISVSPSKQESVSPVKKAKRDESKDMAICRYYLNLFVLNLILK